MKNINKALQKKMRLKKLFYEENQNELLQGKKSKMMHYKQNKAKLTKLIMKKHNNAIHIRTMHFNLI